MYAALARRLGYEKFARVAPAHVLFGLLPQAKSPLLRGVQNTIGQALTGAFIGEMVTDLLQQDNLHGQAAVVGALTGVGQHLGSRYLPKRLFPEVYRSTLEGIRPERLAEVEAAIRAGGGFTSRQLLAGRGLGALAGLAAGLLAAKGIQHLRKKKEPEE